MYTQLDIDIGMAPYTICDQVFKCLTNSWDETERCKSHNLAQFTSVLTYVAQLNISRHMATGFKRSKRRTVIGCLCPQMSTSIMYSS